MTVTPWLGPIFTCGAHYSAEEYLTVLLACLVTVPNFMIGLMLGYLTTKPQNEKRQIGLKQSFDDLHYLYSSLTVIDHEDYVVVICKLLSPYSL